MKRFVLRCGCALLGVELLFLRFFVLPMVQLRKPTHLAQWKVRSEGYGFGFPGLGLQRVGRSWDCSGGCKLTAVQRISFGPFYYERHLEGWMDNPLNAYFGTNSDKGIEEIEATFRELN